MADRWQRTEPASPKRLEKARRDGRFPAAREFVSAVQFLAFVALAAQWGPGWLEAVRATTRALLGRAFALGFSAAALTRVAVELAWRVLLPLGVAGAGLLAATLGAQMAVTRLGFSTARLAPDWARLSLLGRLRELPRRNLPALWHALGMLPLFALAAYAIASHSLQSFRAMPLAGVEAGAGRLAGAVVDLLWKAAAVFLVFGVIDLARERRRYRRDLRMSKQELREETQESEGSPQMKQRIRRLQRDFARRRMMREVPQATAVIANPTHYAVAIRYHMAWMSAPVVAAKGQNYLALRIRALALEHQVPVIENPPLAQALYRSTEVGQQIPAHLYRAVAEILAYIYRLQGRRRG